ncbi:MAG: right-handed parallel beta-helix repeat-containing protein [Candidatus Pacearchaeota archaeon]|nr:right-handed parallel beta-helix repeat-containing protein [Candidatus Pacearchaeota archaeon]
MGGKKRFSKSSKTHISQKRNFSRFSDITPRKGSPVFIVAIFVFSAIFVFTLGLFASSILTGHAVSSFGSSGGSTSPTYPLSIQQANNTNNTVNQTGISNPSSGTSGTSGSGTSTSPNLFMRIWNSIFGSGQSQRDEQPGDCPCNSCEDCTSKLNSPFCSAVKLTQDINSTGTCIDNPENFNNKTFDCQGHSIIGTADYYGIYFSYKFGNTIKNCTIINNSMGIFMELSSNNSLINNNLLFNYHAIFVQYSSNNSLINNTIESNVGYGFYLSGESFNNLFQGNDISDNGVGIRNSYVPYSNSNILSNYVCDNDMDFNNEGGWNGTYGANNSCDKPDGWNDTGKIGCTYQCAEECSCTSCDDCTNKLSNITCSVVKLTQNITNIDSENACIRRSSLGTRNQIFDCQGKQIKIYGIFDQNVGIWVDADNENFTIKNCTIIGEKINETYGIAVLNQLSTVIIDNKIENFSRDGIYSANYPANMTLFRNRICDNSPYDLAAFLGWGNSSGSNNSCDKPDEWNDTGYIGCSWYCNGTQGQRQPVIITPLYPTNNQIIQIQGNSTDITFNISCTNNGEVCELCSIEFTHEEGRTHANMVRHNYLWDYNRGLRFFIPGERYQFNYTCDGVSSPTYYFRNYKA